MPKKSVFWPQNVFQGEILAETAFWPLQAVLAATLVVGGKIVVQALERGVLI